MVWYLARWTSSLSEALAFDEGQIYHLRTSRFNLGPQNWHFGKTHFTSTTVWWCENQSFHLIVSSDIGNLTHKYESRLTKASVWCNTSVLICEHGSTNHIILSHLHRPLSLTKMESTVDLVWINLAPRNCLSQKIWVLFPNAQSVL